MNQFVRIRHLGRADYVSTWQAMQDFTAKRDAQTADEIWLVEHPPVYTLGQAGRPHHVLNAGQVPLVQTDRGGQVTYHGPGQVVAYVLIDLRRAGLFVKSLVTALEDAVMATLTEMGVSGACRKPSAPGVYVLFEGDLAKIAALGIKVKQGCTYHGVALNVDVDLSPFGGIDPCGYPGLQTVNMRQMGSSATFVEVSLSLCRQIVQHCGLRVE
jgi:lipoyl(octanoyl) transferase